MPALVAGIHVLSKFQKSWMAGTSPAMTIASSTIIGRTEPSSPDAVERVAAVAGEGPHLFGPTPGFDRLGPFRACEHLRPIDLVDRRMARAFMRDALFLATDADRKGLALGARDRMHARHFEQ